MISFSCFIFIYLQDLAICVVIVGIICSCVFYCLVHEKDNPLPGTGYDKQFQIEKKPTPSQKDDCDEEIDTKSHCNKKRASRFSFKGMIKSYSADKICKTQDAMERKISSMSCPESDVLERISSISCPENDIEMFPLPKNQSSGIPGILKGKSQTNTPNITKKRISFVSTHSVIEDDPQERQEIAKPKGGLRKHWKEWFKEPSFYQARQDTILGM